MANVFSKFKAYVALRKDIRGRLLPYLRDASKKEVVFDFIDPIPEAIASIRARLNENKGSHRKIAQKYDAFASSIAAHNERVEETERQLDGFNVEGFLADPIGPAYEQLLSRVEAASFVLSFKSAVLPYGEIAEKVVDFSTNIHLVQEQYSLYEADWRIADLSNRRYVDIAERDQYLETLRTCSEKLKEYTHLYYDFSFLDKGEERVKQHNVCVVEEDKKDELLNDVNGRSLDEEQREAIVKDDITALTIAGAGSGKTLTICGKLKWLIYRKGVSPEDILLLSYSKKSAEDLSAKAQAIHPSLSASTFHATGLSILREKQGRPPLVEEQYEAIVESFFREEMFSNPKIGKKVLQYMSLYSTAEPDKRYKNAGELYADLKEANYQTLKDLLLDLSEDKEKRETIKREYVKSDQELALANFYFINGIRYEYEHPYEVDTSSRDYRQYKPDFYLPDYGIYHEHYGLDEEGRARQFYRVEEVEYLAGVRWKRSLHEENGTTCIETFSYQFKGDQVFDILRKQLEELGVEFHPLSDKEVQEALRSIYAGQNFRSFINLVKSFVNLYKSRYRDESSFEELGNREFSSGYAKTRTLYFLDLCREVYRYYMDAIRSQNKIDFDDMILMAKDELSSVNGFAYKYIIVDEFQDISYSRMEFLNALIHKGHARLFAVGDDWQAIYRFSGCDLSIFLEFGNYFGEHVLNKITSTHRNSMELQDIVGPFITANPDQIQKTIRSDISLPYPIRVVRYSEDKAGRFEDIVTHIAEGKPNAHILVLGRNNKDIEKVLSPSMVLVREKMGEEGFAKIKSSKNKGVEMRYSTVHGSKGLEEDYVILISADDAQNGFPNKTEDDPLLDMVLGKRSKFDYAEERRLWYVALTRTRSYVYILSHVYHPSPFLLEIKEGCKYVDAPDRVDEEGEMLLCPRCKSGHLQMRQGRSGSFLGCSNYPYCDYVISDFEAVERGIRCRKCGDFMVLRKGSNGPFYGCHSYPSCTYTRPLKVRDDPMEDIRLLRHIWRGIHK